MARTDPVCLSICTRCRPAGFEGPEVERPGYRLAGAVHDHLRSDAAASRSLTLRGVRCMSQCKRPCAVALSAPGKFTLLFGDLTPATDVDAILHLAGQYARSSEGLIPRPERPAALRSGILGRIPPLGYDDELLDQTFTLPSKPK